MATYTLEELSIYFGVSRSTIDCWVNDKKLDIPGRKGLKGDSLWTAKTGHKYPIQDIVDLWMKENQNSKEASDIEIVRIFEKRYGGSLQETLSKKSIQSLSAQEESDLSAWRYLASKEG